MSRRRAASAPGRPGDPTDRRARARAYARGLRAPRKQKKKKKKPQHICRRRPQAKGARFGTELGESGRRSVVFSAHGLTRRCRGRSATPASTISTRPSPSPGPRQAERLGPGASKRPISLHRQRPSRGDRHIRARCRGPDDLVETARTPAGRPADPGAIAYSPRRTFGRRHREIVAILSSVQGHSRPARRGLCSPQPAAAARRRPQCDAMLVIGSAKLQLAAPSRVPSARACGTPDRLAGEIDLAGSTA